MDKATIIKLINTSFSTVCSLLVQYFQPSINLLEALAICISIDFFIGLWHSYSINQKFSPRKFLGKIKEIGLFIVVLFATISINPLWKQYGIAEQFIANSFIGAYGFYHFFSILQNAGKLGFPIANYFQKFIESKVADISDLKIKEVANEDKK